MSSDCPSRSNRAYATGSMCPIRGRVLRYCHRLRLIRNLAHSAIHYDSTSKQSKEDADISLGLAVHCMRHALRHLAFASAVNNTEQLEGLSRFYTTHNYGAHILNMMEMHNPGAYPYPLHRHSVSNPKASLNEYISALQTRRQSCLTPKAFIWSWKVCCLAVNSLNIPKVWHSYSSGIRPRHIAFALLSLLDCFVVNLYRRGFAWIVMAPTSGDAPAVIPLFNRSDSRLIDPSLRRTEFGKTYCRHRYYDPRDWPQPPPELINWLDAR